MAEDIAIDIPMPLIVCVEDVGWWSGTDGSQFNQPFRTGMPRDHVPEDYLALAALGRGLDMKVISGFVLCEWDKENILRRVPSTTWMGNRWAVSPKDREKKEKAAYILEKNKNHIEFGLHGVGHEFWKDGKMQRTEFHDDACRMRDRDEIRKHLDCFFEIMDQYRFGFEPRTFIPPALRHSFGNNGIQKILSEYGIRQVILDFHKAKMTAKPQYDDIAWENDVLLVERGTADHPWHRVAARPQFDFDRPVLALHWANILHPDPEKNRLIVADWIRFVKENVLENGILAARDSKACFTQYLHKRLSGIEHHGAEIVIDVGWMNEMPAHLVGNDLFLKIKNPTSNRFRIIHACMEAVHSSFDNGFTQLAIQPGTEKIHLIPV